MPCYHPMTAYRSRVQDENGKRGIVFNIADGLSDMPLTLPCGQCIGCRLERSRQWAIRCIHEAQLHPENSFITLTFSDEHMNKDKSLVKADFQKFMKRLRKRHDDRKIRYFHCGEYGELLKRPHHHACLFGFDFPDKVHYSTRNGVKLYTSEELLLLWPYGFSTVGDVTFESAAYVARYVMKKITGKEGEKEYAGRIPPYVTMSRRPGIAAGWIEKFATDVYPSDEVIIRGGFKCKPPRFYDEIYDRETGGLDPVKDKRKKGQYRRKENSSLARLAAKEEITMQKLKQSRRIVDEESTI